MTRRQKFATQVDAGLLAEIREIAARDGRQMQAVVEDAFRVYLDERRGARPRSKIIDLSRASHERYASLYEHLAR